MNSETLSNEFLIRYIGRSILCISVAVSIFLVVRAFFPHGLI